MYDISLDSRGIRFLEKPHIYICHLAAVMESPVKRRGRPQKSSGSSCSLRGKDIEQDYS